MKIQTKKVPIKVLKPYWRNPRMNGQAISSVAQSIKDYGFNQPIIVDKDMNIIAGHTRYSSMSFLQETEVEVIVAKMTEKEAKEYRVVDNRTGDIATWNVEKLIEEIHLIEDDVFKDLYFPNIKVTKETFDDVVNEKNKVDTPAKDEAGYSIICPFCNYKFQIDENQNVKAQ